MVLHTGRNSLAPNERNSQTGLHTASATLVLTQNSQRG